MIRKIGSCLFCNNPDDVCYTHCSNSTDGKHEIDPDSLVLTRNSWGDFSLDGFCHACGQAGGIPFSPDDIQWN